MTHTSRRSLIGALLLFFVSSLATSSTSLAKTPRKESATQRFAILVGANKGDSTRQELRYAIKDAHAFSDVLEEFGGVVRPLVLEDPDIATIEEALASLDERTRKSAGKRQELIFYYSGHSDESGLLLGEELYPYKTLRAQLAAMDIDVKVVILDSCASGNITRKKGGKRTPAFLQDGANDVHGEAYLTSSAATESAQESDRLQSSFFTHAMIAGLRGAADRTGDRRVTLQEAYQYAYEETLSRTQSTLGGAQHATHDFDLTGHGELVLTDYSDADQAILQLSRTLRGQIFIWNEDRQLVAELSKIPGQELEIALPPTRYEVQLLMPSRAGTTTIKLKASEITRLSEERFEEIPREATASRGTLPYAPDVPLPTLHRTLPFGLDLLPRVGFSTFYPDGVRITSLNLLVGQSGGLRGFEVSGLGSLLDGAAHGVQIAGLSNIVQGSARGLQIAGLLNVATRGARGSQIGALNYAGDDLAGSQIGAGNLTRGALRGSQLGALNLQLGPIASQGMQLGVVNINHRMSGFQLGAFNLHMSGQQDPSSSREPNTLAQTGVVNLATAPLQGFMFGVVNVAPTASASFGLINVFWQEPLRLTAWTTSAADLSIGLLHGTRSTYSTYTLGTHHWTPRARREDVTPDGARREGPIMLQPRTFSLGLGYGWRRALLSKSQIRLDATAHWLIEEPRDFGRLNLLSTAKLAWVQDLSPTLSVYAGPSFNVLLAQEADRHDIAPPGSWKPHDADRVVSPAITLWPGVFIGVDLL